MATSVDKMVGLIRDGVCAGVPETAKGISQMQDEDGNTLIKLGFDTHREIITEIGYEADENVAMDVAAALAAVCSIAKEKKVMEAVLIKPADIEVLLSDNGEADQDNKQAVAIAGAMLMEAIRYYSMKINENMKAEQAEKTEK